MAPSMTSTPERTASRKGFSVREGEDGIDGRPTHVGPRHVERKRSRWRGGRGRALPSTWATVAGTRTGMRPALLVVLAGAPLWRGALVCARPDPPPVAPVQPPPAPVASVPPAEPAPLAPVAWPDGLTAIMSPHGAPHTQPLPLDAEGHERWLAVVGTPDEALGAFRVARGADGAYLG